jgi:hypothetical protein
MPDAKITRTLTPEIAERLAKLLGLLGSDHAGERAAAALKADELLKREGLRWCDVIRPREPLAVETSNNSNSAETVFRPSENDDWRAMVRACMAQAAELSARELQFVRTMTRWRGEPTDKQFEWLESIYERIGDGR